MDDEAQRAIRTYRNYIDGYLAHRHQIPAGNLIEIGFDHMESSPQTTTRHVDEQLSLPDFNAAESALTTYLATIRDYKKNQYTNLDTETQQMLQREWRPGFEEWHYG